MFLNLLLLFTLVPIIELFFLFEVSDSIGGWNTIGLIFITGVVGAALAKSQGRAVLNQIQTKLNQGQLPTNDLVAGLLVFGGGLLLLTPGFFTDILGFSMVFPLTRPLFVTWLKAKFTSGIESGKVNFTFTQFGGGPRGPFGGQQQSGQSFDRRSDDSETSRSNDSVENPFENQNRHVFDDIEESPFIDEQQVIDVNHRDADSKKQDD